MFLLSQLLRFLNESWSASGGRARLVYLAMTLAFAGLAVAAAVLGDAAVAAVAAVVAIVTFALTLVAPRLARITSPPPDVR
jgi:hypothetical protein